MSREEKKDKEISPEEFQSLNEAAMDALRGKFGVNLKIRAGSAALKEVLKGIERSTPLDISGSLYDRGFDRTSPGYDRYYDRDRPTLESSIDDIIIPKDITKRRLDPEKT